MPQLFYTHFQDWHDQYDQWSDVIRVHPNPPKTFSSYRIPKIVTQSLLEADRTLQAGAYIATCVMFGRAFEALCRDILEKTSPGTETKRLMLGAGIKALKEKNIIDQRLYDWGQQVQAFRNLAAHGEDFNASREDAEDLQAFVHAITEYVYDLADRYEVFKERAEERKKPRPTAAEMFAGVLPSTCSFGKPAHVSALRKSADRHRLYAACGAATREGCEARLADPAIEEQAVPTDDAGPTSALLGSGVLMAGGGESAMCYRPRSYCR